MADNNIVQHSETKLNPNVNNLGDNTFFQSAYHGTPYRFDKISLENIGTGEGAQAHGWGLYFAENKEDLIKALELGNGKFINVPNNNAGEAAKINDKTVEKSISNISIIFGR